MFRADLHCHSTCSDGTLTPIQLIQLAKEQNLQGLSITDHDTIAAYDTAVAAAKEAGIFLGTGIEFSCGFKGANVHILGYDFSLENAQIKEMCVLHQQRRLLRNRAILGKLERLRMPIAESELPQNNKTIGRPHIAELMVKKGYVKSAKEAFSYYLGDGKRCYEPGKHFTIEETIAVIHGAGGKAFLAHPHLIQNGASIQDILKMPFDGIECHYAKSTSDRWLKLAKKNNLLISGGSDFHGAIRPQIPLGSSWVDESTFKSIFSNLKE